jgi:hypothetical protein
MVTQIANLNFAHADTLSCTLLGRHWQRFDYRLKCLQHWDKGLTGAFVGIGHERSDCTYAGIHKLTIAPGKPNLANFSSRALSSAIRELSAIAGNSVPFCCATPDCSRYELPR